MLVYNAEIWPEYKVAHTESDWTGFKITSDITVPMVGNIGFSWPQIRFCGAALRYTWIGKVRQI